MGPVALKNDCSFVTVQRYLKHETAISFAWIDMSTFSKLSLVSIFDDIIANQE